MTARNTLVLVVSLSTSLPAAELPYADDPAITKLIEGLEPGGSLLLPAVRVEAGELRMHGMEKSGPGQRDYCNRMPYATDRRTALYAGGNHQVPHRMNDVWEYHLGSNTWHLLYAPDGGNAGRHKSAYFLTSRTLVRDPDRELSEKERGQIDAYRAWWAEHVAFEDGHLATKRGGPIMPSHTWDAFCYDDRAGRLLWGMGAGPAGQLSTHAYFTGRTVEDLESEVDPTYTPMWTFDPAVRRWSHYRTSGKHAELRGMGATMTYLPDLRRSLWYVAAQNVSPAAYEMWTFDAVADEWTELRPNGGKTIGELAGKLGVAPMAEQQTTYSPKHRKLVAVKGPDTFVYDVSANTWTKATTDDRIYGHDARSVFGYDDRTERFMLAFPPEGRGKRLRLASYSLDDNAWTLLTPDGPEVPEPKYGGHMGYLDPRFGVLVIQARYTDRLWVYRPES